MKLYHRIRHRSHADVEPSQVQIKTNPPTQKDQFSNEKIGSSVLNFARNKGLKSITRFAQELNINDLKRKGKRQNEKMLNLSDGTALLIAIDQRTYEADDDYVGKAALRMAVTKELQEKYPNEKIRWDESVGVAEAGDGFYATVPIFRNEGLSIGLGIGFSAGIILRYRTSQAIVGQNKACGRLSLPFTAEDARQMQAGQEFELCGQGKLRADFQIAARYGAGAALAVAGAQVSLAPVGTVAAEYSLNVMSIDGNNKLRVTIRKIDQESITLNASALLGIIFPNNSITVGNWGVPQVGHGLLKYLAEHKGNATVESYINDYTTLSLTASIGHTHKGTHICSFDLDLSNPRAAQAYADLMRLDAGLASELAYANDGIVKVDFKETQHTNRTALRLALCAEKLFLAEALKSKSHGELIDEHGSHHIYRDRTYKKHKENWFTGQTDALWEAVEIKKDEEKPKTYYHFNYRKNDLFTRQSEINHFFRFAEALGIEHVDNSQIKVIDMHSYKKLFSSADDTELNVDLYFSSAGVKRIRASSEEQIIQAFLSSRAELKTRLAGHPWLSEEQPHKKQNLKIFELYTHARRYQGLFPYYYNLVKKLKRNYFALNNRTLKKDYKAWRQARHFAKLTHGLVAREQQRDKIGKFFTSIGRARSCHYATVIPTLSQLAGRDNVLVHALSAIGGGVMLMSVDEGSLTHPRNELVKLCMRARAI